MRETEQDTEIPSFRVVPPNRRLWLRSVAGSLAWMLVLAMMPSGCRVVSTKGTEQRSFADFEPHLTRDLTPARARALFGTPSQEAGSGLMIYVYELEGERELWLGFPGEAPIAYAKVRSADGSSRDLTLR